MNAGGDSKPETLGSAEQDELVQRVLIGINAGDWDLVKATLHPYLHWAEPAGTLRGRTNVLTHLKTVSNATPPSSCELRDSQIYRWTASAG